jgi:nucleotide-binding universal stress UspA family protein
MKTIIIASDYSDCAFNAAKHGSFLAHQLQAKVILFHVSHWPAIDADTSAEIQLQNELVAEHIGKLEEIGRQLKEMYSVNMEYAVRFGIFLEQLNQLVESQRACLVVMGNHGNNPLLEKLFGSACRSVLNEAAYPVCIVPASAPTKPIERILFACDYSTLSADNTLDLLKEIAVINRSHIQVIHIAQPHHVLADGSLAVEGAHLEKVLSGVDHQFGWVDEEKVSEGIAQCNSTYQADLLVMVPRKRKFWEQWIDPSLTHEMTLHLDIPLLALPNPT